MNLAEPQFYAYHYENTRAIGFMFKKDFINKIAELDYDHTHATRNWIRQRLTSNCPTSPEEMNYALFHPNHLIIKNDDSDKYTAI